MKYNLWKVIKVRKLAHMLFNNLYQFLRVFCTK